MNTTLYFLAMIIIGILTGTMTGLTGASGVIVVVPLVSLMLNFPVHQSIGTSLMVDTIAPLLISYTYFKHGNIDFKSGLWLAFGAVFGAQLSALFVTGISGPNLGLGFGVFLIAMSAMIWKKGFNRQSPENNSVKGMRLNRHYQRAAVSLILGFALGIQAGFVGAGGGALILLILLFVLNIPLRRAIGTSTLIMSLTACSGTFGYALRGNINYLAGLIIALSAVAGGITSARLAHKVDEKFLARVIGIIFMSLGTLMILMRWMPDLISLPQFLADK